MMNRLSRLLFNKVPQELTDDEHINAARTRVENALEVFERAADEVSRANIALAKLLSAKREEHARLLKTMEETEYLMDQNNKLKTRLDEFSPKKKES